jgi:hypothetical protein
MSWTGWRSEFTMSHHLAKYHLLHEKNFSVELEAETSTQLVKTYLFLNHLNERRVLLVM